MQGRRGRGQGRTYTCRYKHIHPRKSIPQTRERQSGPKSAAKTDDCCMIGLSICTCMSRPDPKRLYLGKILHLDCRVRWAPMMASTNGSTNLQWWVEHLKDATISPLSRDYPEQNTEDGAKRPIEALEHASIPEGLQASLSKLREHGTPSEVLLSALVVLVARLTGDEDISLGVNRAQDGAPFTLRLPFTSSESFGNLLRRVKAELSQGNARIIPLQDLRSTLKTSNLFKFAAYEMSTEAFSEGMGAADLVINYHIVQSNNLSLQAKYNQRLFASARIAGVLEQLCEIIGNASNDSSQAVGRIEIAGYGSKEKLPNPTSDL